MEGEQSDKKASVRFLRFGGRDFSGLIRQNLKVLETSWLVVHSGRSEVVVRDGSPADLRLRNNDGGDCVPTGLHEVDGELHRSYFVNPNLL